MKIKRWSIPVLIDIPDEKYLYIDELSFMNDMLKSSVEGMRKSNFDTQVCKQEVSLFFEDGWDSNYVSDDFESKLGLFSGDGRYFSIWSSLWHLTNEGYDVRDKWREFRDLLKSIWTLLPDFYKGANIANKSWGLPSEVVEQPADYDPDEPFPNLEFPMDID